MFDDSKLTSIRKDYPILQREIEGHPIVYLDNAATSQAPMCVVKAIEDMYFHHRANVHRGVHTLSGEATDMVEATREKVRAFINAASVEEVVFTRGTTEAINLVAATYGDRLCNGDEIILTTMEHHSNIVPWQLIGKDKRIRIRVVPINDAGEVNLDEYAAWLSDSSYFLDTRATFWSLSPFTKMAIRPLLSFSTVSEHLPTTTNDSPAFAFSFK